MTFNFGEYKDWSTDGTWYSTLATGLINYILWQCMYNIIQLMTFHEVNTRIDQAMEHDIHQGLEFRRQHQ
jgi:hypothetical protein